MRTRFLNLCLGLWLLGVLIALAGLGCKPDYPTCEKDRDCRDKEYCVARKCQQCRDTGDCAAGQRCAAGRCEDAPGQGAPGASADAGAGAAGEPAAATSACALPTVFFDFNEATLTSEATTRLADAADCLRAAPGAPRPMRAVGHADPRGTEEYNLALSERRARAVRDHLGRLGLQPAAVHLLPRGALDAKGIDEATWARDRRVELTVP